MLVTLALAILLVVTASAGHAAENVFVYGVTGPPESLDSAKAFTDRSVWATWLLCDALINISQDGARLEPALAESWTLSDDGLRATVRLRRGVVFHDGTPVDAAAVRSSFERQFRLDHQLYTPEPRNTKEKLLSDLIDDIQVQDGSTVGFKLKYPGFAYFSQIDVVGPAALATAGREFGRKPVCAGPFKVDRWLPDRIEMVANDKYWGGRPRLDRVIFRFIEEQREIVERLLGGELHFTPNLRDPVFLERLRESPRVKVVSVPGLNVYYLGFYTERPPFDSRLLRRAVAQSIDVARAALFLGRGAAVAAKGPLSPAMRGYDPAVSQAAFDPDSARRLVSQAGFDVSRPLRLVHDSAVTMDAEIAGAIQRDLRQIGLKVELVGKPSSRDLVTAVRARDGDMFLYSWHLRAPYPERLLIPLFHSGASEATNLSRYRNMALDRLLDEALRLHEGPAQNALYSRTQQVIVDDAPMIFLYHLTRMAAQAQRVRGLDLNLGVLPHDKLVKVDLVP
ncbi:MAG: ABC transporter substrate-binding protein [Candidatus Rokuibacteriota bacterium]